MLFNSYSFIAFLAIIIALHQSRLPWKFKKLNLLLASYLFYALWNPPFVLLLWLSTVVDFLVGKKLYLENRLAKRKLLLFASLGINLGMLGLFKYGGFLLENFSMLLSLAGISFQPASPSIILPVGISFYTFQTLSYTIDMYKKRTVPEKSLLDFSLFVSFFPQLVAGPIVRPAQLIPQFRKERKTSREGFFTGMMLLTLGLFMKTVLADSMLSGAADLVFGSTQPVAVVDAWLGVLAFSGQIFFDFAGYSTCAIGIAAMLGFTLPENFRYPYAAMGFSDFWRRWHISLSSWLRDYIYIPLGGNRISIPVTYFNLMATMLVGGLWHGASWTFVAWGGLHGIYLAVERFFRKKNTGTVEMARREMIEARASFAPAFLYSKKAGMVISMLLTFFLVNIAWVFFRATDFNSARVLLGSMFGMTDGAAVLPSLDMIRVIMVTLLMLACHWTLRNRQIVQLAQQSRWWVTGIVWAALLILVVLSQKSSDSFIYFQF